VAGAPASGQAPIPKRVWPDQCFKALKGGTKIVRAARPPEKG